MKGSLPRMFALDAGDPQSMRLGAKVVPLEPPKSGLTDREKFEKIDWSFTGLPNHLSLKRTKRHINKTMFSAVNDVLNSYALIRFWTPRDVANSLAFVTGYLASVRTDEEIGDQMVLGESVADIVREARHRVRQQIVDRLRNYKPKSPQALSEQDLRELEVLEDNFKVHLKRASNIWEPPKDSGVNPWSPNLYGKKAHAIITDEAGPTTVTLPIPRYNGTKIVHASSAEKKPGAVVPVNVFFEESTPIKKPLAQKPIKKPSKKNWSAETAVPVQSVAVPLCCPIGTTVNVRMRGKHWSAIVTNPGEAVQQSIGFATDVEWWIDVMSHGGIQVARYPAGDIETAFYMSIWTAKQSDDSIQQGEKLCLKLATGGVIPASVLAENTIQREASPEMIYAPSKGYVSIGYDPANGPDRTTISVRVGEIAAATKREGVANRVADKKSEFAKMLETAAASRLRK